MSVAGGRPGRTSFSQASRPFATPLNGPAHVHRQRSIDEDAVFRQSTLRSMLKALGWTNRDAIPKPESVPQSPQVFSLDGRRTKNVFNTAWFADPYENSVDDSDSVASAAISAFSSSGPHDVIDELVNDVEIVYFPEGAVLVEQGERNPGLYYVIDGFLSCDSEAKKSAPRSSNAFGSQYPSTRHSSRAASRSAERYGSASDSDSLYLIKPGGLAGYLGTVSSYRSFVDVSAKTDVYVAFLPRLSIERVIDRHPIILLTMAKRLTTLLPRLIRKLDFALEWTHVSAGDQVYGQGEESDAIYIVLNGRLRSIREADEHIRITGEYGQGDSVGELEVLTESTRPGSLHAIRDTELARLPRTLFNSLALDHPSVTVSISKLIARRMRALIEGPRSQPHDRGTSGGPNNVASHTNIRTVAVLPVTAGVPVVEFGNRLLTAFSQIGHENGVVSLNQAMILNHLGRHAFNRMGKLKLSQYLADLEEKYGFVLYVADTGPQALWTQTCIAQADCIVLVGLAEGSQAIGEFERLLLTTKTTARKELVLLHSEKYCAPGLSRNWLRVRPWINGSLYHIHMAFRLNAGPVHPQNRRFGSALKQRVQILQAEYQKQLQKYTSRKQRQTPLYSSDAPFKGDFHRLARRLTGKAVGLVLGGGGARGIAHVGIIRALEEEGIPIDIIGGTSIGAMIGALYAWEADVLTMYGRAKRFAARMGSMWRFILDLTYPTSSYTTGHEFNRNIYKILGNSQIEDFHLEYFTNTTNISKSGAMYHSSGTAWRYVRASMSLAGLVPPLCDGGSMLLDGGYLDNLPVNHMRSMGADVIFACDVGALDDTTPQQYGDSLSGWWAFLNKWNPFSALPNPPSYSEIQSKLAYVSSIDALERAKVMPGCHYMRPPVENYGTLEFGNFDEIYDVGYNYARRFLAELRDEGRLPIMEESDEKKKMQRTMAPRRASI